MNGIVLHGGWRCSATSIFQTIARMRRAVLPVVLTVLLWPAAPLTAQTPMAVRERALAALSGELRVGAEFFLNRSATQESVNENFRLMRDSGLTLVRIFIIWDDIERAPGRWDFTRYDWIYDAAARNGIQIAATLCSEDPPGWRNRTPFYHHYTNLDIPEYRENAAEYLDKVVSHYRNHPAQGAWLLMNEPNKYDTDAATFKAFGRWLEKKYKTVEELNRHWFRPLASFSEASIGSQALSDYWIDPEAYVDWKEFNVDNLIDVLDWIQQRVLAIDPNHPTHFNVTAPTGDAKGQDVWKEKRVPDILGVSMHAAWSFAAETPASDYGERYAYRLDLIGNASMSAPEKPFWVTELQSGPTIFTGHFQLTPTPQVLSRWMWDSYGAGSKAVIFWLWQPRDIGTEGGEWGLVGLDDAPSPRLAAVKAVAAVLKREPWLAVAHPQPARVAILYNREAVIAADMDGRRQERQHEVEEALYGCYMALLRTHVPTQFVDLDQLKSGEVDKFAVLYAPDSYALDAQGVEALKAYVRQGGTLWADGLTAWKTETTGVRTSIPGGLSDVFGVEASEIDPVQAGHPYSVTAEDEQGGELWRLSLRLKGAEVLLSDKEGRPFAMRHRYGKGEAIFYESGVSLAYARRNHPLVRQWIAAPALVQQAGMPVRLEHGLGLEAESDKVILRGLVSPRGPLAILTNWGPAQIAVVSFTGEHAVRNGLTGEKLPVSILGGRTQVRVTLAEGASALLETE